MAIPAPAPLLATAETEDNFSALIAFPPCENLAMNLVPGDGVRWGELTVDTLLLAVGIAVSVPADCHKS
ncbi:MAG: hypothetical protein GY832_05165 [Chloroflexi bacterium]|nr:hypothetical protein [Chloroflexota bacterium]